MNFSIKSPTLHHKDSAEPTQRGFTIVELLIVIVVIGILAAITIVAYNGVQEQARDARRKSDLNQIAQLIQLYDHDKGPMWVGSGCGSNGNGSGWFNLGSPSYPKSMMQCLQEDNTVPASTTIIDPSGKVSCGGLTCHAYMKYTCSQGGNTVTYILANLETVAHTDTDTDSTCRTDLDTVYGMNYFVKVTDA